MKIVNTDNFDSYYPNESFVNLPILSRKAANIIADTVNSEWSGKNLPRYWKVVSEDYKLNTDGPND